MKNKYDLLAEISIAIFLFVIFACVITITVALTHQDQSALVILGSISLGAYIAFRIMRYVE